MGAEQHHELARQFVKCAILTVSDTRTAADDTSGNLLREKLEQAGHQVIQHVILKDEPALIREKLLEWSDLSELQVVILNGGTGISRRDNTFEAVTSLLEKQLTGFGEIFRILSFAEIGPAAFLSRATAGTFRNLVVFSIPGSPAAVRLASDRLIVPELAHVVWELSRHGTKPTSCPHHHAPKATGASDAAPGAALPPFRPETKAEFNSKKMSKVTLFQSPRVLVGLNCFEPGQEHALHTHAGMDKIYHVIEGHGVFLQASGETPMEPGMMLVAPENIPHGIRNTSNGRLVVLTILTPAP